MVLAIGNGTVGRATCFVAVTLYMHLAGTFILSRHFAVVPARGELMPEGVTSHDFWRRVLGTRILKIFSIFSCSGKVAEKLIL